MQKMYGEQNADRSLEHQSWNHLAAKLQLC